MLSIKDQIRYGQYGNNNNNNNKYLSYFHFLSRFKLTFYKLSLFNKTQWIMITLPGT